MKKISLKIPRVFRNVFFLIFVIFLIWMIFFDTNSLLTHWELNREINDLEGEKEYYKREIEKDAKEIKELSTEDGLEKFARETYYMKKEDEDIYIIEYEDSLAKQHKDG